MATAGGGCSQRTLLVAELRLLGPDEFALIEERTASVNQLRTASKGYYPVVLDAFDDRTAPSSWSFIQRFPTPAAAARQASDSGRN